ALKRPGYGWARRIELQLPVHDAARWQNPRVLECVAAALKFLTGDEWKLTFTGAKLSADSDFGKQSLFEWGDTGRTITP
ncbi:hypothetical protein KC221_30285, partial [Mycobacterium tuberculosis]|nr:hypothetical protein [Mycobacterium tuberculosis]